MKCSNCGFVFGDNIKFCPECGTAVPVEESPAVEEKVETSVVEEKAETPVATQTVETPIVEAEPTQPVSKGLAIASLTCGILSLVTCCCCTYLGIALGIAGILCGCFQTKDEFDKKPTMAIVGIILSSIAIAVSVIGIIVSLTSPAYKEMMNNLLNGVY